MTCELLYFYLICVLTCLLYILIYCMRFCRSFRLITLNIGRYLETGVAFTDRSYTHTWYTRILLLNFFQFCTLKFLVLGDAYILSLGSLGAACESISRGGATFTWCTWTYVGEVPKASFARFIFKSSWCKASCIVSSSKFLVLNRQVHLSYI